MKDREKSDFGEDKCISLLCVTQLHTIITGANGKINNNGPKIVPGSRSIEGASHLLTFATVSENMSSSDQKTHVVTTMGSQWSLLTQPDARGNVWLFDRP